jgi:hypothetical protein
LPFAARQHDDKTWRMCLRKGRTCLFVKEGWFPKVQIKFPTHARAKACADALNERWKEFEAFEKGKGDESIFWWVVDTIRANEGLTKSDWERIYDGPATTA